jgi:hypothetical protein
MRRTVRGASALLAAGMLAVGLGACGDDDDEADAGSEAEANDLAAEAASDGGEFCDAAVAVDAASLGLDSGETSPDDFDQALTTAEDSAPEEIAAAVGTMVTEGRAMMAEAEATAEEEGPPPMPSDEFYPASVEVGGYLSDSCDFETLDVTATNYQFDGFSETVPAGTTVLNFTNDGTEFHEVILVQIAEGEERSLEELMALPEEESDALVTEKGFVFSPPGAQTYTTADLDPGRYVAICFVPVGATPEALASGAALNDEDGHFMHGMVTEFEVA